MEPEKLASRGIAKRAMRLPSARQLATTSEVAIVLVSPA
jgi:DNA-binding transcriptional regulator YhcF (GntR family)